MKGSKAMGKKSRKRNMIHCRRCGKRTMTLGKMVCASCGFGRTRRLRSYNWHKKK